MQYSCFAQACMDALSLEMKCGTFISLENGDDMFGDDISKWQWKHDSEPLVVSGEKSVSVESPKSHECICNIKAVSYVRCMLSICFSITISPCHSSTFLLYSMTSSVSSISARGQLWCCFVSFLCSSLSSRRPHLEQLLTALHVHIMTLITLLVTGPLRNTAEHS